VIPNSKFGRYNISLGGATKLNNGLKVDATLNYVNTSQVGIPGGNGGSAFGQITRIPRSYDLIGRPYKNELGRSIYFLTTQNHPLWSTAYEQLRGKLDRVFGSLQLGYDITNWLNVSYRITGDVYTDRRQLKLEIGASRAPTGQVSKDNWFRSEYNGDLIVTAKKNNLFTEGFDVLLLLGQNINQRSNHNTYVVGERANDHSRKLSPQHPGDHQSDRGDYFHQRRERNRPQAGLFRAGHPGRRQVGYHYHARPYVLPGGRQIIGRRSNDAEDPERLRGNSPHIPGNARRRQPDRARTGAGAVYALSNPLDPKRLTARPFGGLFLFAAPRTGTYRGPGMNPIRQKQVPKRPHSGIEWAQNRSKHALN
jgi:hypothetical protein